MIFPVKLASAALVATVVATSLQAQQATETLAPAAGAARNAPPAAVMTGTGPNGATLRCRDGSHPAPFAADAACADKGGVLHRYTLRATPQQAARPTAPAARTQARVQARVQAPSAAQVDSARPAGFVPYDQRRALEAGESATPPAGATLRCNDGTWIVRDTVSARCANRGGVGLRIAQPEGPRPRPRGG
jgi:hypothetical protein